MAENRRFNGNTMKDNDIWLKCEIEFAFYDVFQECV